MLGLIGSSAANIVGSAYNIWNTERNFQLQKDNLAYQKDLQNRIFEREDSSLQRRVADAEAAGLNPQLALGSGASAGQAVSTIAPQHDNINIDFVDRAISLEKNLKELELLNEEKIGKSNQNALLALQLMMERHNFRYFSDRNLPTNASGQYVQLMEALGSVIEAVKGNNKTSIGNILHEWFENQEKRDNPKSPSSTDLPFDDDYTFEDSLEKLKSAPQRAMDWASRKMSQLKEWRRKKIPFLNKKN